MNDTKDISLTLQNSQTRSAHFELGQIYFYIHADFICERDPGISVALKRDGQVKSHHLLINER